MKYLKPFVAIVLAVAMLAACHNNKNNQNKTRTGANPSSQDSTYKSPPKNNFKPKHNLITITAIVGRSKHLSTLVNILSKANEAQMLNDKGPFTLFAPNNKAFNRMIKKGEKRFKTMKNPKLTNLVNYFIVKGIYKTDSLRNGQTLTTLNGKKLKVKKSGDSLMINDAKIVKADIPAANGVVQIVDRVLIPPHTTNP